MRDNPLKTKLARGETVFGTFVFEFASPGMARIAKSAGCEYIILDMEHSGWGFETVKDQIQFARGAGIVPLVNPPGDDFNLITRSLDLGAKGILVPVVETKAQAEAIVRATRYPPHGRRGSAFGVELVFGGSGGDGVGGTGVAHGDDVAALLESFDEGFAGEGLREAEGRGEER